MPQPPRPWPLACRDPGLPGAQNDDQRPRSVVSQGFQGCGDRVRSVREVDDGQRQPALVGFFDPCHHHPLHPAGHVWVGGQGRLDGVDRVARSQEHQSSHARC